MINIRNKIINKGKEPLNASTSSTNLTKVLNTSVGKFPFYSEYKKNPIGILKKPNKINQINLNHPNSKGKNYINNIILHQIGRDTKNNIGREGTNTKDSSTNTKGSMQSEHNFTYYPKGSLSNNGEGNKESIKNNKKPKIDCPEELHFYSVGIFQKAKNIENNF
ncbi:MAG: hypothetical protein MJ252_27470 [archaeon]|nr:hypothetical protein [archaeon]